MEDELLQLSKKLKFYQEEADRVANQMVEMTRLSTKPLFLNDLLKPIKLTPTKDK